MIAAQKAQEAARVAAEAAQKAAAAAAALATQQQQQQQQQQQPSSKPPLASLTARAGEALPESLPLGALSPLDPSKPPPAQLAAAAATHRFARLRAVAVASCSSSAASIQPASQRRS